MDIFDKLVRCVGDGYLRMKIKCVDKVGQLGQGGAQRQ